jgi:hypothetical protein
MFVCTSYAEPNILTGNVSKLSKDIFILKSLADSKTYMLSTNFKNPSRKQIEKSSKNKSELTVIGDVDRIAVGPDTGKVLVNPSGQIVFKVESYLIPGKSGSETVKFETIECGEGCYMSFIDAKGKKQAYAAIEDMPFYKKFANNPKMKNKNVKIYWNFAGKDKVVLHAETIN